ncbi:ornithine decarboxylase antizyme [Amylocarpus encephaloides]|uniref:Ornithine decarboxylase antizyme n=1 Tax=Amylocarpus encephaloides TaxID=45428 RepID=A0A9P7YTQ4_9HELO|nr:ornithine decarboxylase antizyme [Amylocarpus encephaloides]
MSPSKTNNHRSSTSNRNGESVGRPANVLASAYCVDSSARLTGFRNGIPEALGNQGLPSPPSSPLLAALTSANELALMSKSNKSRDNDHSGRNKKGSRREGAAYYIREECERLFCETMKEVFFGEKEISSSNGSIVMGVDLYNQHRQSSSYFRGKGHGQVIDAYIEVWDYTDGCSFHGFVGGNGDDKALFVFLNSAVVGRDLKQGLMALIELAETVFAVSQLALCVDRSVEERERKPFLKSLRWVGFEMITLDLWAGLLDVTSDKYLFLGMEI